MVEWAWGREGVRDNLGRLKLGNEWSRERRQQLKGYSESKESFILKLEDVRVSLYATGSDLDRGVTEDVG